MALMECPECQNSISDSAEICPHCGVVSNKNAIKKNMKYRKLAIASLLGFYVDCPECRQFCISDSAERCFNCGFVLYYKRAIKKIAKYLMAAIALGFLTLVLVNFTAIRGLLGSNDALATRIENEVGSLNLFIADIKDAVFGGNRGGELRERGLEQSIAAEAAVAAPAAEAARGTLQAKIREQALRDQAAGIDIQTTQTTDSGFISANAEQVRAMVSAEEEFIQLRIKLQGQVRDKQIDQAQATAQLNSYVAERVRQLEEETEMMLIAE